MSIVKPFVKRFVKRLVFFFIFATGCCGDKHHHRTIALFNKSICKSLKDNSDAFIPFKKRVVYYACKNRETRKGSNPYAVVATDILRKYIYIVNVVVIYIILYSL
jgi:hypothetical protein